MSLIVALVRPQMGENIGAAARVMANFEFDDLRIVNPRDGWPNEKAGEMSASAKYIIDSATICDSLEEALKDCDYALASTARPRDMEKEALIPEEAAKQADAHSNVALVFGPENSGLNNEDISLCDVIIQIPTSPEYPSLNLAQAVAICAYSFAAKDMNKPGNSKRPLAPKEELYGLFSHLEAELDKKGYFPVPEKKPKMIETLRNIFHHAELTDQEVRTLRGVVKYLSRDDK